MRRGEPIGAGRIFDRHILKRMDWNIFPRDIQGGLDNASYRLTLAHKGSVMLAQEESAMALDIKSTYWENKWDYETISKLQGVTHINNPDAFLDQYFPDANEWINNLRASEEKK